MLLGLFRIPSFSSSESSSKINYLIYKFLLTKRRKDYGYLRMTKELVNRGFHVNKKKVQRLIRKLGIEVRSFTRRSRRYNSYRGKIGMITKNRIH